MSSRIEPPRRGMTLEESRRYLRVSCKYHRATLAYLTPFPEIQVALAKDRSVYVRRELASRFDPLCQEAASILAKDRAFVVRVLHFRHDPEATMRLFKQAKKDVEIEAILRHAYPLTEELCDVGVVHRENVVRYRVASQTENRRHLVRLAEDAVDWVAMEAIRRLTSDELTPILERLSDRTGLYEVLSEKIDIMDVFG